MFGRALRKFSGNFFGTRDIAPGEIHLRTICHDVLPLVSGRRNRCERFGQVTLRFRGREMAPPDFGRRILDRLIEDLEGIAAAETRPSMQGNQMHIILSGVAGTKKGQGG